MYSSFKMVEHAALLREFYAPCADLSPGMVRIGDCESLFTHLKKKHLPLETHLASHFSSIQPATEQGELESAFWLPGRGNPAGGLTKSKSDLAPLLNLPSTHSLLPKEAGA